MVDVCPASNVTLDSIVKWDNGKEVGFVVNTFVVSDILFIVSVTVLYFYCASRSKKKQPHFQSSVIVHSDTVRVRDSKIRFNRSLSCPGLFM